MPVIQKRASDLLSMFVGGLEKAIASAFSQARCVLNFRRGGLALGQSRFRHAVMRDKPSQRDADLDGKPSVSLRLQGQSRGPTGPRDPAALYIQCGDPSAGRGATWNAFRKFFGSEPPAAIFDIEGLTPGDMAVVAHRCNVLGEQVRKTIIDALLDEACAKNNGGIRPGFRQSSKESFGDTKR